MIKIILSKPSENEQFCISLMHNDTDYTKQPFGK